MNERQAGTFLLTLLLVASLAIAGLSGSATAEEIDDDVVDEVNDDEIATVNEMVEEVNAGLGNVSAVEGVDPVEAETDAEAEAEAERLWDEADRLEEAVLTQVVAEINYRSQEKIGRDIADDSVSTPEEARTEAQNIEDTYVHIDEDAQTAADSLWQNADRVEAIRENLTAAATELADPPTGVVEGTVTNDDGEPVDGAEIAVEGSVESTTTGADGTYELELREGSYTLTVEADDHEGIESTIEVAENETVDGDVTMAATESDDDGDDEADADEPDEGEDDGLPGFGAATALVALLAAVAIARR
ncbi:carboxypeptidase-like regulatory domain-containing protein [Halosolutus amylolyticus]|uniref:Carboxypeptidase-like regulatory domain-containing protein n=1 Tax=Halosolutus amylolyticus TaxID=2932267 RepID=A0ABD5PTD8_9EURY|nr:carboxypeptidase-like regulatory domain-containing protein [Halosolutus amylolyticus]